MILGIITSDLFSFRFSCGYAYYAISYSVDQLSGDLYLNMFLLSVIDIPALMSIWYLSNR